ncbi:MAG: HFLK protein [Christensenellales bacterium]
MDDFGFYGKGLTGYMHYMLSTGSGGNNGGGGGGGNGCGCLILIVIAVGFVLLCSILGK